MARQTSSVVIGAFVLGAVLLAVAAAVVLSGGWFWRHGATHVAFFDGSLDGLDVGAPVTFNGVRIGSVTDVRVVIEPDGTSIRTPVVFEIDVRRLHEAGGGRLTVERGPHGLDGLIRRGLRARLEMQSVVTGQRVVALNFYPDTPARFIGSKRYPEVPTVPSTIDTLTRTLQSLPIDTLVAETIRAMRSVEALASAPEVRSALGKLDRVLGNVDALVRTVHGRVDPLATAVEETAAVARTAMADAQAAITRLAPAASDTLAEYQKLAQDARKAVAHTDAEIGSVAAAARTTLADAQGVLGDARGVLGDDSPVRDDLTKTLHEMTRTARALRTLADSLEQHPEALLLGKRRDERP